MNYIKKEEVNLLVPGRFNEKVLIQKGLFDADSILSEKYLVIQAFYKYLLEDYLDEFLLLHEYDDKIKNSSLNFKEVSEQDKDIYQRLSRLHYYYIRNTLFIEKLSLEDLNYLVLKLKRKSFILDEETRKLLERTWKEVIKQDLDDNIVNICYGPMIPQCMARNDALVLGLRYDEDSDKIQSDEEVFEDYKNKTLFLKELLEEQNNFYQKFDNPVSIIRYDRGSVIQGKSLER